MCQLSWVGHFLATRRVDVDLESENLKIRVNDEEFVFNICKTLKLGDNLKVLSMIN